MKKIILSFLLHHANRYAKHMLVGRSELYAIKDLLLKKYGTHLSFQVQHIEGKPCDSCDATGMYRKYDYYDNHYYKELCWSCGGTGFYKLPQWNLLAVYKFGPYQFHSPSGRHYGVQNPHPLGFTIIHDYIQYPKTKTGKYCALVLFLFYNRNELKRQLNQEKHRLSIRLNNKIMRIKNISWQDAILYPPTWPAMYFIKADGSLEEELPF